MHTEAKLAAGTARLASVGWFVIVVDWRGFVSSRMVLVAAPLIHGLAVFGFGGFLPSGRLARRVAAIAFAAGMLGLAVWFFHLTHVSYLTGRI